MKPHIDRRMLINRLLFAVVMVVALALVIGTEIMGA